MGPSFGPAKNINSVPDHQLHYSISGIRGEIDVPGDFKHATPIIHLGRQHQSPNVFGERLTRGAHFRVLQELASGATLRT